MEASPKGETFNSILQNFPNVIVFYNTGLSEIYIDIQKLFI